MKKIIYILILSCFFISCKKDKKQEVNSPIVGTWVWYQTISIYNGDTTTPQSTNKNWVITFNADNTCSQSGTLFNETSGTYDLSTSYNMDLLNINFTDGIHGHFYEFIDGRTMKFGSGPVADVSQDYFYRALTF